jgi:hypothetical protein
MYYHWYRLSVASTNSGIMHGGWKTTFHEKEYGADGQKKKYSLKKDLLLFKVFTADTEHTSAQ